MRPEILFPLFAPVTELKGVGPRLAKLFERLTGPRAVDLCWHLPTGLIDRRYAPKIVQAMPGRVATLTVMVGQHQVPHSPRQPYRVSCHDETGQMDLVYFHARADYLTKILPQGEQRVVSGKLEVFSGALQMTHPDHVGRLEELAGLQTVEPVYPLTAGLTQNVVVKAVRAALQRCPDPPEWLDPALMRREGWFAWRDALMTAHRPGEETDLNPTTPARRRLAYDELLANQLALALIRRAMAKGRGKPNEGDRRLRERAEAALPYALTASQRTALAEISADMASNARMLRLLQGDVGSGKTIVAFMAMLSAVEAGHQAALMAPTEILARQHLQSLEPLCRNLGVTIELITGRDKGKAREAKLGRLAAGDCQIAVGTHALFQKDIEFADLGMAVIDEQHRFGVHQRLELTAKGRAADILVMTATPIPRTLLLTAYGDMETSRLTEKPLGRQPIATRVLSLERLEDVTAAVGRALARNQKVYWVCPLIEESEVGDLAAAEARFRTLSQTFGEQVGLVHGRMKPAEKDAAMAQFAEGPMNLLVATTVIEVGVDVAAASVMVVEHAERFGLSQLHQLRGRIGRGSEASTCLLLYQGPLGETARGRLGIMRETDDGFRIAEEDLRLRGAGELLGTRQSGMPVFRLAELPLHSDLLDMARDDAKLVLQRDPELHSPRGEVLRVLLYLFERDAAVKYLRSG